MRWMLLPVWVAVTVILLVMVISSDLFAKKRDDKLGMRLLLCFIWPVALLTKAGRKVLFKTSEGL